ncbi:MAG: hypothetical protein JWN94_1735 [Betaproteobacteria bacterium]|nr:hypothetical protein [Betaproteobacteria bacterium]
MADLVVLEIFAFWEGLAIEQIPGRSKVAPVGTFVNPIYLMDRQPS